jgi:PadR family transcriptional regulator PadR
MDIGNIKKACTETLVVQLLTKGSLHGYEMAKEVERRSGGYFVFKHGTLYPTLHRLEKDGIIAGKWSAGEPGERPRKYYHLTKKGRRSRQKNTAAWKEFFAILTNLIPEVAP